MNMDKRVKVRDLREDNEKTQQEIADFLGCERSGYARIERDERALPLWVADRLADYYGTSVDYIIGRTEIKEPYPKE